jgi:hypothetical protein
MIAEAVMGQEVDCRGPEQQVERFPFLLAFGGHGQRPGGGGGVGLDRLVRELDQRVPFHLGLDLEPGAPGRPGSVELEAVVGGLALGAFVPALVDSRRRRGRG